MLKRLIDTTAKELTSYNKAELLTAISESEGRTLAHSLQRGDKGETSYLPQDGHVTFTIGRKSLQKEKSTVIFLKDK